MADYGINRRYTRDKVPMQVLIGFYPTEPVKLSSLAAPLDPAASVGVAIKSGMAIVKDGGNVHGTAVDVGFRNTVAADAASKVSFYIALHDADALDVQASGKLVGLDCSDKFEVQTGYFEPAQTWAIDDPVTVGASGLFTRGDTATHTIVGYITAVGSGAGNTIVLPGKTPSADSVEVIQFKTAQNGQAVA